MAADQKFQRAFSALRNIAAFEQQIQNNQDQLALQRKAMAELLPTLSADQQSLLQSNATQLGVSLT
jgi:hypothetical protein